MEKKISPADKALLLPLLEEKLRRVKQAEAHPAHVLAVDAYKKELVRMLKKINPREHYWS